MTQYRQALPLLLLPFVVAAAGCGDERPGCGACPGGTGGASGGGGGGGGVAGSGGMGGSGGGAGAAGTGGSGGAAGAAGSGGSGGTGGSGGASGSGGGGASGPPSAHFDLSHWKLTVPVNSNGDPTGTAASITTSQLVGGYSSPYFFTGSDGAMVFFAPSNGATTSGSTHTRSEFREHYDPANGHLEWTNSTGGTLSASVQIRQIPINSTQATIGQIHGLNEIMAILAYYRDTKKMTLKLYNPAGTSTATYYDVASNLEVGDRIDYEIRWVGLTLTVTINGQTSSFPVDSSWNGVAVYFKAGAYSVAPSTGNPSGDATRVDFYSLRIAH